MIVRLDEGENRLWLHRLRGVVKAVASAPTGLYRPSGQQAVTAPGRIRVAKPIQRGGKMYIQHYWIVPPRPEEGRRRRPTRPAGPGAPARWRAEELAATLREEGGAAALRAIGIDEQWLERVARAWRDDPEGPIARRLVREARQAFGGEGARVTAKIAALARASLAGRSLTLFRGVRGEAARALLAGARRVRMEPCASLTRDRAHAQSFARSGGAVLTLEPPRASVLLTDLAFPALDDLSEVVIVTRGPVPVVAVEPGSVRLTVRASLAS